MTEFVDRYVIAQDLGSKWNACLAIMNTMRTMITKIQHPSYDKLFGETLVEFNLLSTMSRPNTDIRGAVVWLARDRDSGRLMVVKIYSHAAEPWHLPPSALRQLYCSCRLLQIQMENPELSTRIAQSVQTLLDVQITSGLTVLVFAYNPVMFEQVFPLHGTYDPTFKLGVINDLMRAVRTIHDAGVAHRDIKVQNIAFDSMSRVVLIDFDSGTQTQDDNTQTFRRTLPVCSLFTRPPEHFAEQKYDPFAGDWWSTGCVIAQLFLTGQHLFEVKTNGFESEFLKELCDFCAEFERCFRANDLSSTNTRVKNLMRASMSHELRALLHGLLNLNPNTRIAAAHNYLSQCSS